jgi:hypothetical protein
MRQILIALLLLASPLAAHAQTSFGRIVTDRTLNKLRITGMGVQLLRFISEH